MAPALADPILAAPGPGSRWGDLGRRALSAAILAPIALLCVWTGGPAWAALLTLATIGMAIEWRQLTRGRRLWLLPAGAVYILLPVASLWWLRTLPAGRANVLFVILVVWAADIAAYAAGRMLGGPKLAPAISPGKTWSGALGGVAIATILGLAVGQGLSPGSPLRIAAIALLLAVVSTMGDLFESWLKRQFGVKDSGRLIPGHGGLLDRLDGLMAAAAVAAIAAWMTGRGAALWN